MTHDTTRVYPIDVPNLLSRNKRSISAIEADRAGIDTTRTFFVEFDNVQPTTLDGDNFELITRVTTSPTRPGVRCSQISLVVWGESSAHSFDVMKPGCAYWSNVQFSERIKTGRRDDVSFLGADLRAGGTLKLRVTDQQAHLFINDRLAYKTRYTTPLRRIHGVRMLFAGVGVVHSFSLRDLKSGAAFNGNL